MIIVAEWLQTWLTTQPEYGMGYQKVLATLSSGRIESGFILNSQVFVTESEDKFQVALFNSDWKLVVEEAKKANVYVSNANLRSRPPETLRGVRLIALSNAKTTSNAERQALMAKAASIPAKDAPITTTSTGEIFKRFSAYANDRRVTEKRGLVAGTFGTTREDADGHVECGMDAVHRYALENKKPASNVFTIAPPSNTDLKRGIVEPAYGEPGGGVEVIFVNGSPDGTVSGPAKIPDFK